MIYFLLKSLTLNSYKFTQTDRKIKIIISQIRDKLKRIFWSVQMCTIHTAGNRELLIFSLNVGRRSDRFLFPWLPDSFPWRLRILEHLRIFRKQYILEEEVLK